MKKYLYASLLLGALASPAHAETLQQAMTRAYMANPSLQAARAHLRATDEGVAIAKSSARPQADINASAGLSYAEYNNVSTKLVPRQVGATVTQPIYLGGQIDASVDAAKKNVLAERASLMNTEQQLLLSVAQAFYDVVRDQAVLRLTKKQEEVLTKERQAARDRFKVGEATKTDVSQAESRLAGSTADRIEAEGKLSISQATYERIVGMAPGQLQYEKPVISLPVSLDDALDRSQKNHPQVVAAQYTEQAAENDVDYAQGALLPKLSLEASGAKAWDSGSAFPNDLDSAQILAKLTIPLYHGGDYAKTREAKQTANQRRIEVHDAMDQTRQNTVRAWQELITARAAIQARHSQVDAAQMAYEGVKQESEVGTRTVLDRLDAEAEALQAQVNLVQAERDQAVSSFDTKAAVGELTAAEIALPVTPYDPVQHYDEVKDKWIGLSSTGDRDDPKAGEPLPAPPQAQPAARPITPPLPPTSRAVPVTSNLPEQPVKTAAVDAPMLNADGVRIVQPVRTNPDSPAPVPAPTTTTANSGDITQNMGFNR